MDREVIIYNKSFRDDNIDKVWVLDKVKALLSVPGGDFINQKMVANYYEVDERHIKRIVRDHRDELTKDGMRHISLSEFKRDAIDPSIKNKGYNGGVNRVPSVQSENYNGGVNRVPSIQSESYNGGVGINTSVIKKKTSKIYTFGNGLVLEVPNAGMNIFPRRAVLRVGMLLCESQVARAIRAALLDIVDSKQEVISIQELASLREQISKIMEQNAQIMQQNIEMRAAFDKTMQQNIEMRAAFDKTMQQNERLSKQNSKLYHMLKGDADKLEDEKNGQSTQEQQSGKKMSGFAGVTLDDITQYEEQNRGMYWKQRVNSLINKVVRTTRLDRRSILKSAYGFYEEDYNVDLYDLERQYIKEHDALAKRPTTFDVIEWYETVKCRERERCFETVLQKLAE